MGIYPAPKRHHTRNPLIIQVVTYTQPLIGRLRWLAIYYYFSRELDEGYVAQVVACAIEGNDAGGAGITGEVCQSVSQAGAIGAERRKAAARFRMARKLGQQRE